MTALGNPVAVALASALCFSLGLVLGQFGLARLGPAQGALVSMPTSAALLWLLSPVAMDRHGAVLGGAAIFVLVGLMFPASVTLLTFEANRRMGPTVAGALGNLAPLVAALLFSEISGFVQGLAIVAILIGVAALAVDRRWGPCLSRSAPRAIRGVAQPVTKLGLGLWPSPFARGAVGLHPSRAWSSLPPALSVPARCRRASTAPMSRGLPRWDSPMSRPCCCSTRRWRRAR